ncbi:MAG: hypothetical protein IJX55_00725 [Clostridia bacterium]|nr:hypothetical protein [Clostridia bacterium]
MKTKEERKERKRGFFGEFLANMGVAALLSNALMYVIIPILGYSFLFPVQNFFLTNLLMLVLLCWRFFSWGKNEYDRNRVDFKTFMYAAVPCWALYALLFAVYHLSAIWFPNNYYGGNLPGDGIIALAMLLCGEGEKGMYVTAQRLFYSGAKHGYVCPTVPLPTAYPYALAFSLMFNLAVYIFCSYAFYRAGIREREVYKLDVLGGTQVTDNKAKKWLFYRSFVPLVNYYPLYSWMYDYFVNPIPERRKKYFWRGVLIIAVGMTVIELLRYGFYLLFPAELPNAIVFYLSLHLVGTLISLVAYFDGKRYENLPPPRRD